MLIAGPSLLHEITARLDPENDGPEDSFMETSPPPSSSHPDTFVTHLFPADRPNIMACMKSLVGGFVDRSPDGLQPKRKPSTSLAPYDIELLEAWYDAVRRAHGVYYVCLSSIIPKLVCP
jgi:origin recognition complex subunit 3